MSASQVHVSTHIPVKILLEIIAVNVKKDGQAKTVI